jgi:hypothetical protein
MRRIIALVAVALVTAGAAAQQPQPPAPKPVPKRSGQTIEIRGQAPTPQVVTVRPREVPQYKASSLPQAVMTSGSWPAISTAYAVTPPLLVAGHLPIDTSAAGLARGGASVGAVAGAAAVGAAAAGGASGAGVAGTSSAEIVQMRRDLASRQARLDSLERSMRDNQAHQNALGAAPAAGGAPRMSSADSAARAAEISAIRKELNYRKARLDSLQKEVNSLGSGKKQKKSSAKSDTTKSGKPPRGTR